MDASELTPVSVYEAVGGMPWFTELIDRFYDAVETDLVLRPMYPDDLTAVSYTHLTLPTICSV